MSHPIPLFYLSIKDLRENVPMLNFLQEMASADRISHQILPLSIKSTIGLKNVPNLKMFPQITSFLSTTSFVSCFLIKFLFRKQNLKNPTLFYLHLDNNCISFFFLGYGMGIHFTMTFIFSV